MKKKYFILGLGILFIFSAIGICLVKADTMSEEIIFHLDTTQINFTNDSLKQPINFHITTIDKNHDAGKRYFDYKVSATNTVLKDTRGSLKELNVAAGASATGTLDVTSTVSYNGSIMMTSEKTTSPGVYTGHAVVTFDYNLNPDLNSYTITLNNEGVESKIIVEPNKTPILPTPVRDGYKFLGWFTEANVQITNSTHITSNMTLFAHWKREYKVNCNLYGSTKNNSVYYDETANFKLTTPTRSGYVFAGWTGTDITEPTYTITVDTSKKKDYTFTANWIQETSPRYHLTPKTANGCTLNDWYIDLENSTTSNAYTVFLNVSGPVTTAAAPTWSTANQSDVDWTPLGSGSWTRGGGRYFNYARNFVGKFGDRTYTTHVYLTCNGQATYFYGTKHQAAHVTFTLDLNGGSGISTYVKNHNFGDKVDLTTWGTPTKTNQTFIGWATVSEKPTEIIKNFIVGAGGNKFYAIYIKSSNM